MRIIITSLVLALIMVTLANIEKRVRINEQEQTKKLMKCAYNAGKAGAPLSVLEDNPCIINVVKGRSSWDTYGSDK